MTSLEPPTSPRGKTRPFGKRLIAAMKVIGFGAGMCISGPLIFLSCILIGALFVLFPEEVVEALERNMLRHTTPTSAPS